MDERQRRQEFFEDRDRIALVEERRLRREPEPVMIAA